MGQANSKKRPPINDLLSWKDLVLMTLGFSTFAAPVAVPPFVGLIIALVCFGLAHIDEKVKDPKNKNERQQAFIVSLSLGLVATYATLVATLIYGAAGLPYLIKAGAVVFPICFLLFINYLVRLKATKPLEKSPIDRLLTFRDLILMTLGFSVVAAPLGIPPIVGMLTAMVLFGFTQINRRNINVKDEKKAMFITCLVMSVIATYIAFGGTLIASNPTILVELLKFGAIVFPLCLTLFINYGVSLEWWPAPSIFYFSILVSMVPALILHNKVGMVGPNVIISSLVASSVYAILVGETKGKPEPWMKWQAVYIGIMAGSASAVGLNYMIKTLKGGQIIDITKILPGLELPGLNTKKNPIDDALNTVNGYVGVEWLLLFLIWILVQAKVSMPYKWNTLFSV